MFCSIFNDDQCLKGEKELKFSSGVKRSIQSFGDQKERVLYM